MIRCEQAERLFDAYLDGTLVGSWTAELHAHQLECSGCRRELAMLEACGDVVATDCREPGPGPDFTDRVLGVLAEQRQKVIPWPRRAVRVATGLSTAAAAAVVAFMLMAPHDAPPPQVLAPIEDGDERVVLGTQVDFGEALVNLIELKRVEGSIEEVRGFRQMGRVLFERMLQTTNEKVEGILLSEESAR